ncbi:MAG: mandelate racemase/muconate lactonizing enzyme family protein [Chloroflexi bacterium]|nr:mandelate racemase/muconate lactonizing enzyme family protein [Chloroflexota bacterium]
MKITGVKTQLYEVELLRVLGDANSPTGRNRMAALAVSIDTDEGLVGLAVGSPGSAGTIQAMVNNLLLGRDPRGVKGLWQKMVDFVFKGANRGVVGDALSAIDVALWDLKAKANHEPLWKTLGASTRRVKAYASGIDLPLTDTELYEFYEGMARQGVSAGKLKVGLDPNTDLRRIGIMQQALATSGKKPVLLIDSNEYWSPKQAIRHIRFFEEHYDITWAEEPARRWDYRGLRRVSQGIRAAVATGENLDEINEFTPLIANEAVDVVEVGSGTSGITGAMQVADLAYAFELPVAMMNCPANFMAHLAAALPNHTMMEVVAVGRDAAMIHRHKIEDGWIVLSDAPGLGFTFDEEKLRRFAVEKPSPAAGPSPWGRRRGAGLYEVPPGEPEDLEKE